MMLPSQKVMPSGAAEAAAAGRSAAVWATAADAEGAVWCPRLDVDESDAVENESRAAEHESGVEDAESSRVVVHKKLYAHSQSDANTYNTGSKPQITLEGTSVLLNANTNGAGDHAEQAPEQTWAPAFDTGQK